MKLDWRTNGPMALMAVGLFMATIGKDILTNIVAGPGRMERGIAAFTDPFEVELATAIAAFDVPRVKALLPRATSQNLNDLRGNTTLFVFALERGAGAPASAERLEMVKALLQAGGFPGYPKGRAMAAVGGAGIRDEQAVAGGGRQSE